MDPKEHLDQEIRELLESQKLAVLATHGQGQPYTSLVAFASSTDLREIYFATSRSTRKYDNVTANPKVSLLVDNRSNDVSDFHLAMAATALGHEKTKIRTAPCYQMAITRRAAWFLQPLEL